MKTHGRYFRPKPKELMGTPFDSLTEKRLHEQWTKLSNNKSVTWKPEPVQYEITHLYKPDASLQLPQLNGSTTLLLEVKGYFQDSSETQKYNWVRKSLKEDQELVFVFENPNTKLHWLKARKDGTKMTMAEWADKQGFRWFTIDTVGELIDQ